MRGVSAGILCMGTGKNDLTTSLDRQEFVYSAVHSADQDIAYLGSLFTQGHQILSNLQEYVYLPVAWRLIANRALQINR